MHFDTGPTLASRQSRFNFLMSQKAFACPENLWVADEFNNTSGVGQQFWNNDTAILMPSYFTAVDFLLQPNFVDNAKYNSTGLLEVYSPWATNELYFQLPAGYGPKLSKVGPPSRKIYIADGGLWSEAIAKGATPPATNIPNYTMEYMGAAPSSTCYSDYGAFDAYSRALSRGAASGSPPANITSALDATDPRLYGYRHGTLTPFGITNAYSFNAGFFDGHVETLSDLQGADPNMWNPPGTDIYPLEMMLDVQSTYFPQHVAGSTTPVVTN
jgi:prepilin-type processing-associated H-X9-DG protein